MRKQYGETGVLYLESKHDAAGRNFLSCHIKHTRTHTLHAKGEFMQWLFSLTLKDVVCQKSMADRMAKIMEHLVKFNQLHHVV